MEVLSYVSITKCRACDENPQEADTVWNWCMPCVMRARAHYGERACLNPKCPKQAHISPEWRGRFPGFCSVYCLARNSHLIWEDKDIDPL